MSDDARFALLDASRSTEMTRRNFRRDVPADLAVFGAIDGELPDTYDWDGVLVTGSGASVYWDEAWIRDLLDWLATADERGVPMLGVCFGHQALAQAFGGEVVDMSVEGLEDGDYEIGYRTVSKTAAPEGADLFAGVDDDFLVFTTHGDAVVSLPPGATLLAENEYGVHAFRRGHVFGVQFHPEYDTDSATRVTEGKEFLSDERRRAVLDGVTPENYETACEAKRLFDNFVAYAESVAEERVAASD